MMVKHCVSRGCLVDPVWGYGSALKGTIRWACREHRDLIWLTETPWLVPHTPAPAAAARVSHPPARAAAPIGQQGRLFG